jgi:hypothetical protein
MQGKEARIYRPARNAMQSGTAGSSKWVLEFEPEKKTFQDPIMGWTSSSDMRQEIRLCFSSSQEAVSYAERYGIVYHLEEESPEPAKKKQFLSYAANFRFDRPLPWTH